MLDIKESRVRQLAQHGVTIRVAQKGFYDLEESVRNYVRHLRDAAAGRGDKTLNEESALLKREQREYYHLKNLITKGSIVRFEQIHQAWARVILAVRSAILAIPTIARLRMQLSEEQAEQLTQIIREQLTAASLTEIPPMVEVAE